jgi:chromosomal replication initiator protein
MSEDTHEHWARCLLNIERRVRPQSFDTWFRPTKVGRFDADLLEIEVSSSYFAEWVENNYLSLIQTAVQEETGLSPRVVFSVSGPDENAVHPLPSSAQDNTALPQTVPTVAALSNPSQQAVGHADRSFPQQLAGEAWSNRLFFTPLNERYCFETFVVGEGNRFAHAAAQAVSRSPSKTQFNPLVIYGGVGLGKTHLLQAIGHYALSEESSLRVAYVPSEKFMNDFIESLKAQNTEEFQRSYRSADLLLIDDIQFLLRGEQTQGEFFHTFNALHQNGKQIVMTCDSPPGELEGLEERLISRFQWGLVTSIEPPDLETRIAILHQKAEINGIHLGEEVANFLGSYISSNVRELEGALNHLMAYCAVNQVELGVEAARKIVHERMTLQSDELSIASIQKVVSDHFRLTQELLIGKTRKQEVAAPRQIAMFLAKRLTKSPLKVIGLHFGNRDHSTVIHAVQTVSKKCESDDAFARVVETLSESIQQQHAP